MSKQAKLLENLVVSIPGRVASSKNSRRIIRVKGRVISLPSKAYERYRTEALKVIGMEPRVIPPYEVSYLFEMRGLGATDIDNMVASVNDCLQDAGIITDDRYILRINADKEAQKDEYRTEVRIRHIEPKTPVKKPSYRL